MTTFTLIPNFSGTWSNTVQYAVIQNFGVEPIAYFSPVVKYNGTLYIATYTNSQNPPVGTTPDASALWEVFADSGSGSGTVTSVSSSNGTITVTNPTTTPNLSEYLGIHSTTAPYSTSATDRIVQITNSGTVTMNSGTALSGRVITIVALGGNVAVNATGVSPMTIPSGWAMSFYYNTLDSAWRLASSALPGIQSITSTDGSITISNTNPTTDDLKITPPQGETVNTSSTLTGAKSYIAVGTTGTTQTLPLLSGLSPFLNITITNLNIATTAIAPNGSDTINGSNTPVNIVGAYSTRTFYADPVNGWLLK